MIGEVAALTAGPLAHVDQHYLRPETYVAANAVLIDAQAGLTLPQAWGGGMVAAVDGMRFLVPVRTIDARPNPKYFHRKKGVSWLNMISDQSVGLSGKVVSGTPKDTLHFVDLVISPDSGQRPEVLITDQGPYSDIVFGLVTLLGFDYRPVLADLPDAKLWRINGGADYGALDKAARGRIDVGKIRRHWPDILRVVASVHTREVSAHDVIRVLQRDGRPTDLGEALAHCGRIFKTLHDLTFVDDPQYRREMKGMRNLQEGRHALARHIFHGPTRSSSPTSAGRGGHSVTLTAVMQEPDPIRGNRDSEPRLPLLGLEVTVDRGSRDTELGRDCCHGVNPLAVGAGFFVHFPGDLHLPGSELRLLAAGAPPCPGGGQTVHRPFRHQRMLKLGDRAKNLKEHPPDSCRGINALIKNSQIDSASLGFL